MQTIYVKKKYFSQVGMIISVQSGAAGIPQIWSFSNKGPFFDVRSCSLKGKLLLIRLPGHKLFLHSRYYSEWENEKNENCVDCFFSNQAFFFHAFRIKYLLISRRIPVADIIGGLTQCDGKFVLTSYFCQTSIYWAVGMQNPVLKKKIFNMTFIRTQNPFQNIRALLGVHWSLPIKRARQGCDNRTDLKHYPSCESLTWFPTKVKDNILLP